jgi:hypothetical protein
VTAGRAILGTEQIPIPAPDFISSHIPILTPALIPLPIPALSFPLLSFLRPIAYWLFEDPHVRICADQSEQYRHDLHKHPFTRLDFGRADESLGDHHIETRS